MKKRFLILIMILSLALTFNPQPAQAAITWDFSAITSSIKNAILAAKRQVTLVKENVSQWKIVQNLGGMIKSVSEFYQSAEKYLKAKKEKYLKYMTDIQNFIADANAFYYSALETYHAALDAAEHVTETFNRYQAYLQEGRDIIQFAKETLSYCKDSVTNVFDMAKEAKEQLEEQKKQKEEAEAEVERLQAEIAELERQQGSEEGLTPEEQQRLREIQALLDKYQQWLDEEGTSQQYSRELSRINSEINRLNNLRNSVLAQMNSPEAGGFISEGEITGETSSGPVEMITLSTALKRIDDMIRDLEVEAEVYQEKLRFVSNKEYYRNEIARLEEEKANLGHHNESNVATNWIRDRRDRLEIYMAKIDTFNRAIANINRQIVNFISTQRNMIAQCKWRIATVKARTERLMCNATVGEAEAMDNEIQKLGGSLNNWNDQLVHLQDDWEEFGQDFDGCEQLRVDCEYGMTDEFGSWNWDWDFFHSAEINDEKTQAACEDYLKVCEDTQHEGVLNVKIEPMQGGVPECERSIDELLSSTDYDTTPLIYKHSVSYSEPIASAFIDMGNLSGDEKSGTTEDGVFLLPVGLGKCCDLGNDASGEEIQKCISKFNKARLGSSGQQISDEDKYFYQCIRHELNKPDFDDKTLPNDAAYAGQYLLEGYAEYLAANYLDAMGIYNESFIYKEEQIDPVASNETKDIKSAWIAIVEMNRQISHRINEINRLWSREQAARAYFNAISYGVNSEQESTNAK